MMLNRSQFIKGTLVAITLLFSLIWGAAEARAECEGADGEIWCPDSLPVLDSGLGNGFSQPTTECEGADGEIWCPDSQPLAGHHQSEGISSRRCHSVTQCGSGLLLRTRERHSKTFPQITTECEGADGEIWCPD